MEPFSSTEFNDENIFITAGAYNSKFNKFIIKSDKKLFENKIFEIREEASKSDKNFMEAISVLRSASECINFWIDNVEKLQEGTEEHTNFCHDIAIYYMYSGALFNIIIPIMKH